MTDNFFASILNEHGIDPLVAETETPKRLSPLCPAKT